MSDPQQTWRAKIVQLRDKMFDHIHDGKRCHCRECQLFRYFFAELDDVLAEADALPAPTCATCRFWQRGMVETYGPPTWGDCNRENYPDALIEGDEQNVIGTHESFGCLQHEARQP